MEEFNFIEYLRTEKRLNNYQIGKIQELLDSFVKDDSHSHASFEFCPKCGKFHPHVIRSGFAGSGKQLYRCTECGRRFSYDHGTVTWYSHQNADQWKTLILDTFEGVGLEKTSRRISVNIETAFNMRHRIMCMMEKELENEVLSGEVELDETFVESSRKSLAAEDDADFGVVAERVKRGLSKQKVCIASGVDGSGNAFAHAYNCGQFGQTAAMNLSSHIADGSLVTTDNTSSYDRLLREKGCFHKSCPDCTDHNAEVNLNRINSFHSMIKEFYRGYRGVATKYINRYASLFSFAWKYHKIDGDELFEAVRKMMAKGRQSLTIAEVENFRLFLPHDIEWRPAV